MSEVFPEPDEACDRMLVAVRRMIDDGRLSDARMALNAFRRAMEDGDDARMRHELSVMEVGR